MGYLVMFLVVWVCYAIGFGALVYRMFRGGFSGVWSVVANSFLIGYGILTSLDCVVLLAQGLSPVGFSWYFPTEGDMVTFQAVWLAGTVFFGLGTLWGALVSVRLGPRSLPETEIELSSTKLMFCMALVGLATAITLYRSGVFSNPTLLLDRTGLMYASKDQSFKLPYTQLFYAFVGSFLLSYDRRRPRMNFVCIMFIGAFLGFSLLAMGSRKPLIDTAFIYVAYAIIRRIKVLRLKNIVVATVLLVSMITYFAYRGQVTAYLLGQAPIATAQVPGIGFLYADGGNAYYVTLDAYYNGFDLSNQIGGTTLIDFIPQQIPRTLYPGTKRPALNESYNRTKGYQGGFSIPSIAEGVMNFGRVGFVLFVLVFGFIVRTVETLVLRLGRFGVVFYVCSCWLGYFAAISDLTQFFVVAKDGFLVLLIMYPLLFIRRTKAEAVTV